MTVEFGRLLNKYSLGSGVSKPELAERIGMDPSHVRKIFRGDRNPSPEKAILMADVLGIAVNKRAEFYLSAAGFPSAEIAKILEQSTTSPLIGIDSVKTTYDGKKITVNIELT